MHVVWKQAGNSELPMYLQRRQRYMMVLGESQCVTFMAKMETSEQPMLTSVVTWQGVDETSACLREGLTSK